jgi:hypothetical protein
LRAISIYAMVHSIRIPPADLGSLAEETAYSNHTDCLDSTMKIIAHPKDSSKNE